MSKSVNLSEGINLTGLISPAEERFERWRRKLGFLLAPVIFGFLWFAPFPGLEPPAHRLLAVFGIVITLWISEAIPLPATALLAPALCVLCGVMSERDIFRSFGNPILFLFMGSFLLAEGMLQHGLNRRIAFSILGMRWVAQSPARILAAFGVATGVLSMWISNTTATAMMFPIALAILSEMGRRDSEFAIHEAGPRPSKYATGLMLVTAFASSIGGMATPVGTPPNLIAIGFLRQSAGREITFFQWMAFGVPLAAIMLIFLIFYLNRFCAAEPGLLNRSESWVQGQKAQLGGLTVGERNVIIAFAFTVILWLLPGVMATFWGTDSAGYLWLNAHLPEGVCALLGAALLFVIPTRWSEGKFTLTWRQAAHIDWGTIILFGGGLAIGDAMFATGLAKWMGSGIASTVQAQTTLSLVILFSIIAVLLSETTSNTATATMVTPVAIAVSQAAGVDPLQPVIAVCLCSSVSSMLPVSTPPNAIVYGSGYVPLLKMVRHGGVLDVFSIVVVVAAVYWLVPFVLRLPQL